MKIRMEVNTPDEWFDGDASHAEFELTQEKLYRIMRFAQIVKEQEIYCLQEFDYSLSFLVEVDEDELQPFEGRMECCSLHVCSDRFYWSGYYKHTNIRWETDELTIKDMLDALHEMEEGCEP